VVVVVPALAHGQERSEPDIATLHGGTANFAPDRAVVVRKMAD
jgi:hypothetical protein